MKIINDRDFEAIYLASEKRGFVQPHPVIVEFEIAAQQTEVISMEGKQISKVGDIIVTGIVGEKYIVSPELFFRTRYHNIIFYDTSMSAGTAQKKVSLDTRYAWCKPKCFFQAVAYSAILEGSDEDILIRYKENEFGIVNSILFSKLYVACNEPLLKN